MALKQESLSYKDFMNVCTEAVFICDRAGNLLDYNENAMKKFIDNQQNFLEKNIDFLQPKVRPLHLKILNLSTLDEGVYEDVAVQSRNEVIAIELGLTFLKENRVYFIKDTNLKTNIQKELLSKHNDLQRVHLELQKRNAELHATQELMIQSGKMAALGQLSVGIAHEINQPLFVVRGFAQQIEYFLKQSPLNMEKIEKCILEMIQGCDRINEIIKSMRSFVREETGTLDWFDLNESVRNAEKLLSYSVNEKNIPIILELYSDKKIFSNKGLIEQVLVNIIKNGIDAILEKNIHDGKMKIITKNNEKTVTISIQDNGIGMSEETKNKIFEPFFSTKEVGSGMGIGMSLCYGILKKFNAAITISSQMGIGTEFQIHFPIDFRTIQKQQMEEKS